MFENPRRGRQARNFTTNVPKILVLKSSSEQIFSRKLPLGALVELINTYNQIRILLMSPLSHWIKRRRINYKWSHALLGFVLCFISVYYN